MIISPASSSNIKTRIAYAVIFILLIIGSITMIYPFLLMLSGSVKSEADSMLITPYPEFWFNDTILFQKYMESKHNAYIENYRLAWNDSAASWRRIEIPEPVDEDVLTDFKAWRETDAARNLGILGHTGGARLLPVNARLWRKEMEELYGGNLDAYCTASGTIVADWTGVAPPVENIGRYRFPFQNSTARENYLKFKKSRPARDLFFLDSDAMFTANTVKKKYGDKIENLNKAAGTNYSGWRQVKAVPAAGEDPSNPVMASLREDFLRSTAPLQYLRLEITPESEAAYRESLRRRHGVIRAYNAMHRTDYASFDSIRLPERLDDDPSQRVEWEEFVRDKNSCRREWITLYGPAELFREYRIQECGRTAAQADDAPDFASIAAAADLDDCMTGRKALRKEFTVRNYIHVLDYIGKHGNGIVNTLIYCFLAIVTAIIVNPLAAYALSRFNLPGTYQILLFCMATMAFPGEVSMIPSFILLKRFPLWPLAGAGISMIVSYMLLVKYAPKLKEKHRTLISALVSVVVGAIALPLALGPERSTVSLLNTFAALILPGAANGYFIFLLKGFFDSMPKELYEAAELDGASEWTKFWTLTISLSKPILAVIALGAFTGAYSAFMMALIIIPDQDMWTIMVWIFQLQSQSHGAVVYASLVIAAIPTFLVFAFCQNLIIRGIVVPTEK